MAEREPYQYQQFSDDHNWNNNDGPIEDGNRIAADDAAMANNGAPNQGNIDHNSKLQSPTQSEGRKPYDTSDRKVHYLCGECGLSQGFGVGDPMRCSNCGGRTMYKPRVKR